MRFPRVAFALTSGLASPAIALGTSLFGAKVLRHGIRTGMSATTYGPLFTRCLLHELGERPDPAAMKVMRALPSTSQLGLRLINESIRAASQLSGYRPPMLRYASTAQASIVAQLVLRTHFIDRALEEHLEDVAQVVILGAGFDTRAYGMLKRAGVTVFEVDTEATQPHKIAALDRAGIDRSHVRFVRVRFERHDWFDALADAGFDASRPTFFLLEGVSYYLDEEVVRSTLATLADAGAPGSYLLLDYFSQRLLRGRSPETRALVMVLRAMGEPLRFGLADAEPRTASELLEREGWSLRSHEKTGEYGGLILAAR